TSGITSFASTNYVEYPVAGMDAAATVLGTVASGNPAIGCHEGTARSVYLGGIYLGTTGYGLSGMRAGVEDRLLQQPVAWATHARAARHAGDAHYTSSSGSASVTVAKRDPTTNLAAKTAAPAVYGQPITLCLKVMSVPPGAGTPSGNVDILDAGVTVDSTVVNG